MRVAMSDGLKWLCNQCGYIWRVRHEEGSPVRCAACLTRKWDKPRPEDEAG
jgi:rubrerythrin